jgi:hypothetical protein
MYPYGDKTPKKDPGKVWLTLVDVKSKKEKNLLLDWLKKHGYTLMSEEMYDDDGLQTFGIPIDNRVDKVVGYVGCLPVRANQVYHGAKYFHGAVRFIIDFNKITEITSNN